MKPGKGPTAPGSTAAAAADAEVVAADAEATAGVLSAEGAPAANVNAAESSNAANSSNRSSPCMPIAPAGNIHAGMGAAVANGSNTSSSPQEYSTTHQQQAPQSQLQHDESHVVASSPAPAARPTALLAQPSPPSPTRNAATIDQGNEGDEDQDEATEVQQPYDDELLTGPLQHHPTSSEALLSPEPLLGTPMVGSFGSPALLENTYIESQIVTDSDFHKHLGSPSQNTQLDGGGGGNNGGGGGSGRARSASPTGSIGGTDEMLSALGPATPPETPLAATIVQQSLIGGSGTSVAGAADNVSDARDDDGDGDGDDDDDEETEAVDPFLVESALATAANTPPAATEPDATAAETATFDTTCSQGDNGDVDGVHAAPQRWMINQGHPLRLEHDEPSIGMYDEQESVDGSASACTHLERLAVGTAGEVSYVVGCTARELFVWAQAKPTRSSGSGGTNGNNGTANGSGTTRGRRSSSRTRGRARGNDGDNGDASAAPWTLESVRSLVTSEEAHQHRLHYKEHHTSAVVSLKVLGGKCAAVVGKFSDSHVRAFDLSAPAGTSVGTEWTAQPVDSGYSNEMPGAATMLGADTLAVGAWSSSANEVNVYSYTYTAGSADTLRLQQKVLCSHSSFRPLDSLCSVVGQSNLLAGTTGSHMILWNTEHGAFVCKANTSELLPPDEGGGSSNPAPHEVLRCLTAFELPTSSASASPSAAVTNAKGGSQDVGDSDGDKLAVLMVLDRMDTHAGMNVAPTASRSATGLPTARGEVAAAVAAAGDRCMVTVLTRQFMNSATPSHRGQMVSLHELHDPREGPREEGRSGVGEKVAEKRVGAGATGLVEQGTEPVYPASPYSCGQGAADLIFRGDTRGMLRVWNVEDTTPLLKIGLQHHSSSDAAGPGAGAGAGVGGRGGVAAVCADHANRKIAVAFTDGRLCILGQQQQENDDE